MLVADLAPLIDRMALGRQRLICNSTPTDGGHVSMQWIRFMKASLISSSRCSCTFQNRIDVCSAELASIHMRMA